MILGIGNDIVSVERIENLLDKFGERFIKKVSKMSSLRIRRKFVNFRECWGNVSESSGFFWSFVENLFEMKIASPGVEHRVSGVSILFCFWGREMRLHFEHHVSGGRT